MALSKEVLTTELVDDNTPYGGISHTQETLEEFLNELEIFKPYEISIDEVNRLLVENGIERISI